MVLANSEVNNFIPESTELMLQFRTQGEYSHILFRQLPTSAPQYGDADVSCKNPGRPCRVEAKACLRSRMGCQTPEAARHRFTVAGLDACGGRSGGPPVWRFRADVGRAERLGGSFSRGVLGDAWGQLWGTTGLR